MKRNLLLDIFCALAIFIGAGVAGGMLVWQHARGQQPDVKTYIQAVKAVPLSAFASVTESCEESQGIDFWVAALAQAYEDRAIADLATRLCADGPMLGKAQAYRNKERARHDILAAQDQIIAAIERDSE